MLLGFIVEKENPDEAAKAIGKLILDKELRTVMGKKGRERVNKYYNLNNNLVQMLKIYEDLLNKKVVLFNKSS